MSRHTTPAPRKLPRNGRARCYVRLAYVDQLVDEKTNEPLYAEVKNSDGDILFARAPRKVRRSVAFNTRLRNDGKPFGTMPYRSSIPAEATVRSEVLAPADDWDDEVR